MNILAKLGEIQEFTVARFFADDYIEEFQAQLNELEEMIFLLERPQITPKAQALLRHVIPFAQLHKFWGRASEQPIESLHATFNNDFRRFSAIRDKRKLYLQIAEVQEIRNFYFDKRKS